MCLRSSVFFTMGLVAAAVPAAAANVSFTGAVANLCVLTITTPGTLGMAASGTGMSSEDTGGLPALLAVAATGSSPSISFSAPDLNGPSGSTANATKEISYSSPGGANQGYTSQASSYSMNRLIDTVTIKARATNMSGFGTGTYGITSTATCQQ